MCADTPAHSNRLCLEIHCGEATSLRFGYKGRRGRYNCRQILRCYFFMHVCLCACVHPHEFACIRRPEDSLRVPQSLSTTVFWRHGFSLNLELSIRLDWLAHKPQRSSWVFVALASLNDGLQVHATVLDIFTLCLRIELRPSCLQGKHATE